MMLGILIPLTLAAYLFSVVAAHYIFRSLGTSDWRDAAESPLVAVWPLVLLFWLLIGFPVMFFSWICKRTVLSMKRAKARGKYKPEIVK